MIIDCAHMYKEYSNVHTDSSTVHAVTDTSKTVVVPHVAINSACQPRFHWFSCFHFNSKVEAVIFQVLAILVCIVIKLIV